LDVWADETDGSVNSTEEFILIACGSYSTFASIPYGTGAWSVVLWLSVCTSLVSNLFFFVAICGLSR